MNANQKDLNYEYILALCDAVEKFTSYFVSHNPESFYYKEVNLQFAVERYLYFRFLNDEMAFTYFSKAKKESRQEVKAEIQENKALNYRDQVLITFLIGQAVDDLKDMSPFDYVFLNHRDFRLSEYFEKIDELDKKYGEVDYSNTTLFHVTHEKFVKYISPITKNIEQYALLITLINSNSNIYDWLKKHPHNYLDFTNIEAPFPHITCKSILRYFNSILCSFDHFELSLSILKPKSLVCLEGNATHDEIFSQVCKKLGIPTACIQQGGAIIVHNGFRNMSYHKMYLWGQGFVDKFSPYNPKQNFEVVGNHQLGNDRDIPINFEDKDYITFFLQGRTRLITEEIWCSFLDLISKCATSIPDQTFLVRIHPGFTLTEKEKDELGRYKNIIINYSLDSSILEVLDNTFLSVSIFSTTILESIARNVVPLCVNLTSLPEYFPSLSKTKSGIEVKNISSAFEEIEKLSGNKNSLEIFLVGMKNVRENYFGTSVSYPSSVIAQKIEKLAENENISQNIPAINSIKYAFTDTRTNWLRSKVDSLSASGKQKDMWLIEQTKQIQKLKDKLEQSFVEHTVEEISLEAEQMKSQIKILIAKGKEQGYLTYHEVNDHLPDDIVDPEQIEDIIKIINDMGIKVYERHGD